MTACCGLDCSKCDGYLATQADSDIQRAEVAQKWSVLYRKEVKPEQINCDGCRSDGRKFSYCENICAIRKCCKLKSVENCAACGEYVCETLSAFIKMAPQAGKALEKIRQSTQ